MTEEKEEPQQGPPQQAWSSTARQLFEIANAFGDDAAKSERVAQAVLRELVGNGLRALDARFFSKRRRKNLGLSVVSREFDDGLWLAVRDSGSGMTRGDLTNRLAAPGATRADRGDEAEWRDALSQQDAEMLAFGSSALGMGVACVFAMADCLRVTTKHDDDDAYVLDAAFHERAGGFRVRNATDDDDPFFRGNLITKTGTIVAIRCKPGFQMFRKDGIVQNAIAPLAEASQYTIKVLPLGVLDDGDDEEEDEEAVEDDDDDVRMDDVEEPPRTSSFFPQQQEKQQAPQQQKKRKTYLERAKYIPLRLSYAERKHLRLVEAAIKVAGYVNRVDATQAAAKPARRRQLQLQGVAGVLTGLVTAMDPDKGARVAEAQEYGRDGQKFLRRCFEIARRYKILNPERMRTEYGQMVYLLQDAAMPEIQEALGFSIVAPVRTVFTFLRDRDGLALLDDPLVHDATREILPDPTKSRAQIQAMIKRKERAVKHLGRTYGRTDRLTPDDVELCLCSICDNESYLNSARRPIDQTLDLLRTYFDANLVVPEDDVLLSARSRSDRGEDDGPSSSQQRRSMSSDDDDDDEDDPAPPAPKKNVYSLAISDADGSGARLSHSHARQFRFAEQSLSLWRAIVDDMFRLWSLAEGDLLSGDAPYALRDTGQGLQRVQACPRTYAAMVKILQEERNRAAAWVGSSMVHMGDHNVPNALTFLDKYAQVARILRPLITVLDRANTLYHEDKDIKAFIDAQFGHIQHFFITVLADFFRHAFDGSGADNFYDAGSCVDGRLTSAWNWCSQIAHKPYFIVFKLAGFNGFDGEFA